MLGLEPAALSQAVPTRWLSYSHSILSLLKCYSALVMSLEREASERKDVKALGFVKCITEWSFIYTVELLADTLPRLANLSKSLQVGTTTNHRMRAMRLYFASVLHFDL